MIICLIGAIRNWNKIIEVYSDLSNKGNIVLLPVVQGVSKKDLTILHRKKIDLADSVYVVNVNGYMGSGTLEEIGYSLVKNKPIEYLEPQVVNIGEV